MSFSISIVNIVTLNHLRHVKQFSSLNFNALMPRVIMLAEVMSDDIMQETVIPKEGHTRAVMSRSIIMKRKQ